MVKSIKELIEEAYVMGEGKDRIVALEQAQEYHEEQEKKRIIAKENLMSLCQEKNKEIEEFKKRIEMEKGAFEQLEISIRAGDKIIKEQFISKADVKKDITLMQDEGRITVGVMLDLFDKFGILNDEIEKAYGIRLKNKELGISEDESKEVKA